MKANDNLLSARVILPMPPESADAKIEMDVYARFMRHLRHVANSRMEIKVLSAIQFIGDMTDIADEEIAGILVECGLRAPRMAFPATFLEIADAALMRESWENGSAGEALRQLDAHWRNIGEDRLAGFRRHYPSLAESLFIRT